MPSYFRKPFSAKSPEQGLVALQPPGVPFPWPRGTQLLALEEVVLVIPAAVLGDGEKIADIIHSETDTEICLPDSAQGTLIQLRLKVGMNVWLSKSVQGMIAADDDRPRAIKIIAPKG